MTLILTEEELRIFADGYYIGVVEDQWGNNRPIVATCDNRIVA